MFIWEQANAVLVFFVYNRNYAIKILNIELNCIKQTNKLSNKTSATQSHLHPCTWYVYFIRLHRAKFRLGSSSTVTDRSNLECRHFNCWWGGTFAVDISTKQTHRITNNHFIFGKHNQITFWIISHLTLIHIYLWNKDVKHILLDSYTL